MRATKIPTALHPFRCVSMYLWQPFLVTCFSFFDFLFFLPFYRRVNTPSLHHTLTLPEYSPLTHLSSFPNLPRPRGFPRLRQLRQLHISTFHTLVGMGNGEQDAVSWTICRRCPNKPSSALFAAHCFFDGPYLYGSSLLTA